MKFKIVIISCFIFFSATTFSQKNNVWTTYGQSKFIYSPGLEFNHFFTKHIGIQFGVSMYFQDNEPYRIVNVSDSYSYNFFYNANIGLCTNIINKPKHKLGLTSGFKIYYGPEFDILHYYNAGKYYIYFDSSELRPSYGVDFGVFYSYKKITGLVKFDTARKKIRFGIGYTFGEFK